MQLHWVRFSFRVKKLAQTHQPLGGRVPRVRRDRRVQQALMVHLDLPVRAESKAQRVQLVRRGRPVREDKQGFRVLQARLAPLV